MIKQRTYSKYARQVAILLGQQIKLRRKQRQWSEKNLADRAGISRVTLRKIEHGEMNCAIGLVFEVASLVGIHLFTQDNYALARQVEQTNTQLTLLPQRIRTKVEEVDDDF